MDSQRHFQENGTSQRPFLLLRINFPGRPIFIQFIPEYTLTTIFAAEAEFTHVTLDLLHILCFTSHADNVINRNPSLLREDLSSYWPLRLFLHCPQVPSAHVALGIGYSIESWIDTQIVPNCILPALDIHSIERVPSANVDHYLVKRHHLVLCLVQGLSYHLGVAKIWPLIAARWVRCDIG